MILTTRRQHRILSAMYSSLRSSDPRMVATFLMFTRLTSDEAMPPGERIKAGPRRLLRSMIRGAARRWRRVVSRPGCNLREAVGSALFVLAAAAGMYAIALLYR